MFDYEANEEQINNPKDNLKKKFAQRRFISSQYFLARNFYEGFVGANFYTIDTFKHADYTVPS
jgi:hypothetical protein